MPKTTDVIELRKKLEKSLQGYNKPIETTQDPHGRGQVYTITSRQGTLRITLGDAWVGYEFYVSKEALGQSIGISEDTDNYSLGGENIKNTQKIFSQALVCLKALLEGGIYIGKVKRKLVLAIPQTNGSYKVMYKGRFVSREEQCAAGHLESLHLSPLG